MCWPANPSTLEEENEEQEEEEEHKGREEREEADPEPPSTDVELKQGEEEGELEPSGQRRSQDWGSTMEEEERLAFDDLWLDSDATDDGCSPRRLTLHELGLPMEAVVEVHARESEVEDL